VAHATERIEEGEGETKSYMRKRKGRKKSPYKIVKPVRFQKN